MPSQHTDLKDRLLKPNKTFTIVEAEEIVNHVYDHCYIDTEDRFHNIFFYEICPLLLIAKHIGGKATRIAFVGADSRFDGLIFLGNEQKAQKIELTAAIDGHDDALRMELLRKRGHAPAFQKIQATGIKRNRGFGKNETSAICSDEYDYKILLPLLEKALALKIEKAKTNQHYAGAWLGIVFDDWIMPLVERKKERFDPICIQVLGANPERYAPFSRVFCVGVSRLYLFDSGDT